MVRAGDEYGGVFALVSADEGQGEVVIEAAVRTQWPPGPRVVQSASVNLEAGACYLVTLAGSTLAPPAEALLIRE